MKRITENDLIQNGILTSQDYEKRLPALGTMTMADIVETAIQLGFDPKPWATANRYAWNHSLENAACNYLQKNCPELLTGDCGENDYE